jgi:putative MFS transporter
VSEARPPESPDPGDDIREGRPWWSYVIPYAGNVPKLTNKQWSVLGLLSLAELFDQYDVSLMGLALSQIQTGLQIPESEIAGVAAVVRVGSILAFALGVIADRAGRRRMLLMTIVGFTLVTFGTAFVQNATQFMVMQLLARVFITGETLLAVVVLAEELSAKDRGWGIGMLGALGALGHGMSAAVFGFVDVLPYGWRALYLVGVIPLLFLAYFRRRLPETRRFEEHQASVQDRPAELGGLGPVLHLARMYPGRVAVLALALFPFDFVVSTAYQFMPKTLQEVHGYTPGQVTAIFLVGGVLGILGNVIAGQAGDRYGRKPVMCTAMVVNALALVGFYNASGWAVPLLWVAAVFSILAIGVLFKVLGTELFPTSHRSTASGMRLVVGTLGGIAGLSLEGTLYELAGSHAMAITWMAPVLILPPLVIAAFLPETAGRELEDVSPER